ncbi:hypothetical protein BJ684DRAFT_20788 [Piptocephalis cylindrospora]|uniref:Uncharacterized protein n=1 Tax=Piptocephalis cylindrospora TaxID=1907219 RepID=A0A4P9Y1L4_9FUNG|nr:hypothetical protein BJ684DRAFT_20788 [Piptocephalis cylindrospora]|eukprot:RKP12687.1 hypothetical protein BJ684DRAFT_20788 [Piptocephalis cylindrospora]
MKLTTSLAALLLVLPACLSAPADLQPLDDHNYVYQSIVTKDKDNGYYFLCLGPKDGQRSVLRKVGSPQEDCVYEMSFESNGKVITGTNRRVFNFGIPTEGDAVRWETTHEANLTSPLPIEGPENVYLSRFIYEVMTYPDGPLGTNLPEPKIEKYTLKDIAEPLGNPKEGEHSPEREAVMVPWTDAIDNEPINWYTVSWGKTNPVTKSTAQDGSDAPKTN